MPEEPLLLHEVLFFDDQETNMSVSEEPSLGNEEEFVSDATMTEPPAAEAIQLSSSSQSLPATPMSEMRNEARKSQKRRAVNESDAMTLAFNNMSDYIKKKTTEKDEVKDEDELFARSVGEGLRQIKNVKNKYIIKAKIMSLLADALD